jgi:hypothetical protein
MHLCRTLVAVLPGLLLLSELAAAASDAIDQDLMEVTVPQLQRYYAERRYTVTQVVQWHLARVHRYNGIYRAIETSLDRAALETAAREDAEAAAGRVNSAPLWGVPIVIKANTSIAGEITTDGWSGYTIPGHELIAPRDATVVVKLRAAGAILIGHTNMPDFANADTNRSSSFGRTGNAYDVRFSPGGSSGGTVTAVTSNMAVLGTGTDTGNSIRMPSATSGVVGVFPTRGLVSIAGIAPLDWLLDNTGPIARNVTDATIALSVMAGPDALDPPTREAATKAEPGPYTRYLKADALKGRRFGVPVFILGGMGPPFHGVPARVPDVLAEKRLAIRVATYPYVKEGTDLFLRTFGPAQFHSAAEYQELIGQPLGEPIIGTEKTYGQFGDITLTQRKIERRGALGVRVQLRAGHSSPPSAGAGGTGLAHQRAVAVAATSPTQFHAGSANDSNGVLERLFRDDDAEALRGFQIDEQIEDRVLDRERCRLGTLENFGGCTAADLA